MSLETHAQTTAIGLVGASVAGSFTFMGFIAYAIPVLQIISLIIGTAVGIVTFIYYYGKIAAEKLEANALLAAEAVKAKAVVVATALDKIDGQKS